MKALVMIIVAGLIFQFAVLPVVSEAGTAAMTTAQVELASERNAFIDSVIGK